MTTATPAHGAAHHAGADAGASTRASWLMVPVWVVTFIATSYLGVLALDVLGLGEGDLFLFARNAAGWAVEIAFALVLAAPAAAGIGYAVQATRHGGRWGAWTALAVHALMYLFFRLVTRLPARRLTPPDALLAAHGFRLQRRAIHDWGLLHADLWGRAG